MLGDEIRVSEVPEILLDDDLGARYVLGQPVAVTPGESFSRHEEGPIFPTSLSQHSSPVASF